MKSLTNQHWTSLSGEPITGRIPPTLRIMNGVEPTPPQMGGIAHHYKLMTLALKVSVIPFLIQERTLVDGTRIRMVSNYGTDTVMVWPTGGGGKEIRLPHGFVVVADWADPVFYGNVTKPGGKGWTFRAGMAVPQAMNGAIVSYNTRAHTSMKPEKDVTIKPAVLTNGGRVWDWAPHKVEQSVNPKTVPIALQVKGVGFTKKAAHSTHYSGEGKILGAKDAVLHESELTPAILINDPEDAEWLPIASDSEGNEAALQHWRHAVISPIANIWKFVFANEVVRRLAPDAYALTAGSRHIVEFTTPLHEMTETTESGTTDSLEETPEDLLHTTRVTYEMGAAFGIPGGTGYGNTGMKEEPLDISGITVPVPGTVAFTEKIKQAPGDAHKTEHVIAVGGKLAVEHVTIKNAMQYVRDVYWRGGEATSGFDTTVVYGTTWTTDRYGVHGVRLLRKDLHYHVDGTPTLALDVGWTQVKVLDGTTTGRMDGKRYDDITSTHFTNAEWSNSYGGAAPNVWVTRAHPPPDAPEEWPGWFAQNDVLRSDVAAWAEEFGPLPGRIDEEVVTDEDPTNTAEYSLKSRYIIDYDHRGRFYAAIRVEVDCSGASWKHAPEVYLGFLDVDQIPTYIVRIYFESNWNGTTAEKLLVTETVERPMFEAQKIIKTNPYYWPAPVEIERPVHVRMPPVIKPDQNVIFQLRNMTMHQGVNECMVMHDFNDDLPPEMASDDNVEFSYIKGAVEVSHKKRAMGLLYARTFTLSEFSECLWLLTHTKCDAEEGGSTPPLEFPPRPKWFYMPGIKAALDKKFHVELRDGVMTQWSDGVPGAVDKATGGKKKAPTDPTKREIKLYLV